jgi:hypothetical protein
MVVLADGARVPCSFTSLPARGDTIKLLPHPVPVVVERVEWAPMPNPPPRPEKLINIAYTATLFVR